MPWENLNIKDQDRLAQAGVALVEQVMFSNFNAFPDSASGRMTLNKQTGQVQVDTPSGREFVSTAARIDQGAGGFNPEILGQSVTQITNASGAKLQTIDQRWDGRMLDNAIYHQSPTHIFVKDNNDSLLFSIEGNGLPIKEALDSHFGSFKEDTSKTVQDGKGTNEPLQIHFSATNKGNNVLDIMATVSYVDASGQPLLENGKPKPPSTVEVILKIDPSQTSAIYQLQSKGW